MYTSTTTKEIQARVNNFKAAEAAERQRETDRRSLAAAQVAAASGDPAAKNAVRAYKRKLNLL